MLPRSRFFPTTARVNRWLNSSVLPLESGHIVRISAKLLEDDRIEFALQQRIGEEWVDRLLPRPRFFPADPAAERWLYSGRLEPVGYVPFQSRAPTVQGAQTFASWYQRSGSGQDVFQSGVSVDERVEGHGTTTTNGELFLNVMCDVPLDEAGTFRLEVLGFQHLSGVRIYAPLTYQLGDAEPEDAEWRASGDALDQFGVRLRPLEDEAFYEQMRGASSLRIQIEGSPDVDVSFDIRGFFKTTLQRLLRKPLIAPLSSFPRRRESSPDQIWRIDSRLRGNDEHGVSATAAAGQLRAMRQLSASSMAGSVRADPVVARTCRRSAQTWRDKPEIHRADHSHPERAGLDGHDCLRLGQHFDGKGRI